MQITFDSRDQLAAVLRVVEAVYQVELTTVDPAATVQGSPARKTTPSLRSRPAKKTAAGSGGRTGGPRAAGGLGGRKGAATAARTPGRRARVSASPAEIRAWATSHGYTVSGTGRIPGTVIDAYHAAH